MQLKNIGRSTSVAIWSSGSSGEGEGEGAAMGKGELTGGAAIEPKASDDEEWARGRTKGRGGGRTRRSGVGDGQRDQVRQGIGEGEGEGAVRQPGDIVVFGAASGERRTEIGKR